MALDEHDKIAHLLRRAGFAARPEEITAAVARGLQATVDDLINFERFPDVPPDTTLVSALDLTEEVFREQQGAFFSGLTRWWLNAMITTQRPLQEKMVLFWHSLFATSVDNVFDVRQMYLQNQHFRGAFNPDRSVSSPSPFPVGNFRTMIEWLTKDPAMLFFLDNWINSKKDNTVGTNENYARELHELFSMGVDDVVAKVPNYTETDVRQASRALTGWSVAPWNPNQAGNSFPRWFAFQPTVFRTRIEHDFGPYDHLGKHGGSNANFIFDNIVQHRNPGQTQTAVGRFLGFRLFRFFGYHDPEPEIINALADVFDGRTGESPYNIRNMLRTLFTPGNLVSETFYSEKAFKAHVKSPTEYVISGFRLLKPDGLTTAQQVIRMVNNGMIGMGQYLFHPPDVSGWREGPNWINTTFDLARFNYANAFATLQPVQGGPDVTRIVQQNNLQTAEQVVDYFTNLMMPAEIPSEMRTTLITYLLAQDNGTPGPFVLNQPTIDKKVRGLIHLIMSTPDFQLS
jgi:uncharacterized protein (DUF1800 family)